MSVINTFNTDSFSVVFSNIPVPENEPEVDVKLFNNFLKSVTLPDYNLEVQDSYFGNIVRKQPISRINNDLTQMTFDFKVDEDLQNYMACYTWIKELREGRATKHSLGKLHKSNIAAINVIVKDNEKREKYRLVFKECQIISLSALVLQYGINDEVIFSTTMNYHNFEIVKSSVVTNN